MPRLNADTKEKIKNLSRKELEEIVLKTASKEQTILDFITRLFGCRLLFA